MFLKILVFGIMPICLSKAAESVSWGADNTVTYSDSVHMALESDTRTISLSQFNAAAIAKEKGGNASEYTLTKVVLSIDGSVSGLVEFENQSPNSASNVRVRLYDFDHPDDTGKSWSRVSYNGYSAVESYSAEKTFPSVGAAVRAPT